MANKYRVAIAYEEGFVIEIEAKSKEEAEEKAVEMTEEYAEVSSDTVHRDYFTVQSDLME
jgi:hypothetical protein